jgi:hypothetical protein
MVLQEQFMQTKLLEYGIETGIQLTAVDFENMAQEPVISAAVKKFNLIILPEYNIRIIEANNDVARNLLGLNNGCFVDSSLSF